MRRFLSIVLLFFIILRGSSLLTYIGINAGYTWLNYSVVIANKQAQKVALGLFAQVAENQVDSSSAAWRAMGHIHVSQHNEQEAVAMWLMANNDLDMVSEMYSWADISEWNGDSHNALRWYERAIILAPDIADAWYFSALILEADGDITAARHYYQMSLEKTQFHRVGISDVAFRLGALAHTQGQWLEALDWFDLALVESDFRVSDRAGHTRYLRGDIRRLMNEPELALLDYQWVVDNNPNHYWAHIYLGQMIWLVKTDFDEAEALLLHAITLDPARKWAYRSLGDLYRQGQYIEKAIEMYYFVLAIDPQDRLAQTYLNELEYDDN